jgi:myosin-1
MLSTKTWPHYSGANEKDGVQIIVTEKGYQSDCQFGKTKLFIKTPQTVFGLEQSRDQQIPVITILIQKVRFVQVFTTMIFLGVFDYLLVN